MMAVGVKGGHVTQDVFFSRIPAQTPPPSAFPARARPGAGAKTQLLALDSQSQGRRFNKPRPLAMLSTVLKQDKYKWQSCRWM